MQIVSNRMRLRGRNDDVPHVGMKATPQLMQGLGEPLDYRTWLDTGFELTERHVKADGKLGFGNYKVARLRRGKPPCCLANFTGRNKTFTIQDKTSCHFETPLT